MVHLKLILTAIFWGGTFIAGRVVSREMEPFSAAFLRFATASFFLIPYTWKTEKQFFVVNGRQILLLSLLALTGIFSYNYFFFSGLKHITAGRASIIIATNPVLISLLSPLFFKESMTPLKLVGIIASVAGAMVAISRGNWANIGGYFGKGEFLIFMCVASWVAYSLVGKLVMVKLSPLISVTYSATLGAFMLAVPALAKGLLSNVHQYSAQAWWGILYLGFFGTVLGFLWYYQGIKIIGPMKASIFINFVPISAILLSFFILNEPLTLSLLIGAILVISGIYLTNRSRLSR